MPLFDVARTGKKLVVNFSIEKNVGPKYEKTFVDQTLGDDNNDKDAPINSPIPSWEEMAALLKHVPNFTSP